jgi:phospholipid/cholesterol/gamma-HCH transport system ATP-binding protein
MESEPLIELRGAAIESATDSAAPALREVNWRIGADDFWVVGALPGSGKLGLLETAAGLRPPVRGAVIVFGVERTALTGKALAAARARTGFVYGEGGRLLSQLSLAQNIALPLCYRRNCAPEALADDVAQLLAGFGLDAVAGRLPGQVNVAWRQRAALARTLALGPEVLFLYNPLTGLNTTHVRWWLSFLGRELPWPDCLPRRPAAVVVATDDLRPWLATARQFALIQDDRWRVIGGRADLAAAREPLVRELLAEDAAAG